MSTSGLKSTRLVRSKLSNSDFPYRARYSGLSLSKNCLILTAVVSAEVENLNVELKKSKEEAAEQKAAAKRAAAEVTTVKIVSDKHEARVAEVQQELKYAVTKCEDLE